jgi:hypothetical protein
MQAIALYLLFRVEEFTIKVNKCINHLSENKKTKNKLSRRKMKVYIDIKMCAIVFTKELHKWY